MGKIRFIRPPTASSYNNAEFQEEVIITYARGYLDAVGFHNHDVFDFWLNRNIDIRDALDIDADVYVIALREISGTSQYAIKIAQSLIDAGKRVILYGQVGRLSKLRTLDDSIELIHHDERSLAAALGLPTDGPEFAGDLHPKPYFPELNLGVPALKRLRGAVETSRGCQFKCSFCFINHGTNYSSRWTVRRPDMVIHDLIQYKKLGITTIQFRDSEFLGLDERLFQGREELLKSMSAIGDIRAMIYARADSLEKFNRYELLYEAGIRHVYMGVESLAERDLRALKKGFRADSVVSCAHKLSEHRISMQMNFMTFNRATTVESIRENLVNLRKFLDINPKYLGIPTFLFSFEADWTGSLARHDLSDRTYLRWMIWRRGQPTESVVFDAQFEPLLEIFRLYDYEMTEKLTKVLDERRHAKGDDAKGMDRWLSNLWRQGVQVFQVYFDQFERGALTIDTLPSQIDDLYKIIALQFSILPETMRRIETLAHGTALATRISEGVSIPLEDHGWDEALSLPKEDVKAALHA